MDTAHRPRGVTALCAFFGFGAGMAIAVLAVNALGDTINALVRHDFRTLIGVPIAAAMIYYVWRISEGEAMDPKRHWEKIYQTNSSDEVSWFQAEAGRSLELIQRVAPSPASAILDVGAGASTLVDGLLHAGYHTITVLDLSATALTQARARLGEAATQVMWLEADILDVQLQEATVDVWHDRAVFHFLTDAAARRRYVEQVRCAVRPGGHVLIATFAADGPTQCSGLDVARYTPESLHGEFGDSFTLLSSSREEHLTPWGAAQAFVYCLCRHQSGSRAQPPA